MGNKDLEDMSKQEILPICSLCKAVRIGKGNSERWIYPNEIGEKGELYNQLIEKYGKKDRGNGKKETKFTNTYCPECYKQTIKEQGLEDY